MTLALKAMRFARAAHANQVRKYTGEPYAKALCHHGLLKVYSS